MMPRGLLPGAIERLLSWQRKFQRVGFPAGRALRAASSPRLKQAYLTSRIEHLPPHVRGRLHHVVDVGANHGQWASALLSVAQPMRMDVFEPNPEAFAIVKRNLGTRAGLTFHCTALGAQPGELPLNITSHSDFSSFLTPAADTPHYYGDEATAVTRTVMVPVNTLDAVLHDVSTIDLLKIDVQGFERQVLSGAAHTLRRTRALLMEANFMRHYENDDSLGTLTELLDELGFGVWDIAPPFRAPSGRALWCDAVFFNRALVSE